MAASLCYHLPHEDRCKCTAYTHIPEPNIYNQRRIGKEQEKRIEIENGHKRERSVFCVKRKGGT